jgi:hypothetical protein
MLEIVVASVIGLVLVVWTAGLAYSTGPQGIARPVDAGLRPLVDRTLGGATTKELDCWKKK